MPNQENINEKILTELKSIKLGVNALNAALLDKTAESLIESLSLFLKDFYSDSDDYRANPHPSEPAEKPVHDQGLKRGAQQKGKQRLQLQRDHT